MLLLSGLEMPSHRVSINEMFNALNLLSSLISQENDQWLHEALFVSWQADIYAHREALEDGAMGPD